MLSGMPHNVVLRQLFLQAQCLMLDYGGYRTIVLYMRPVKHKVVDECTVAVQLFLASKYSK